MAKKWVLITGASSGFGMDFARELAGQGYGLVMVARRVEPMQVLAHELQLRHGIETRVIGLDLSAPGAGLRLKSELDGAGVAIDMLINNAGFGVYGEFVDASLEQTLKMLQLNILGLTELTHCFGRDMARRGSGQILLVSSLAAYQATPTYAAYSASKAYVLLLGEALHEELRHHGVTVTVLSPGISATEFLSTAGQRSTAYQRLVIMKSLSVVRIGLAALQHGRASIVAGWLNTLTAWGNRFLPRMFQRKVAYQLMKND
jgi:short-subunit dehydrogenase